jgi:hypothetical protein
LPFYSLLEKSQDTMNNKYPWATGLAAGALLWGTVSVATAQWGGYGGYGYYPHSSTVAEGYQRGFADVVRSAGIANLLDSQAANNYEDARAKDYDNRLKGTETYFTMRRINEQYRSAERGTPATSEQLFRWAHRDVPRALNSYEFDPLTGQVNWPLLLRAPGYDDYRRSVEQFFRMRAENPQKLDELSLIRMQELFENWLYTLKGDITAFKPNDYIRSRKFLESLAAEAGKS